MRVGRQQQCMAVRLGSSHQLGSDIATCAGPVLDHYGLPKHRLQPLGKKTR